MSSHLSNEEISRAAAGLELPQSQSQHLGSCVSCRSQVQSFVQLVEARRESLATEEPDWQRQRTAILDRLEQLQSPPVVASEQRRWRRPLLAVAAALLAAAGLSSIVRVQQDSPETVSNNEIAVEELLAEVDALLDDDSIPGLWSVDPLADTSELETLITNGSS